MRTYRTFRHKGATFRICCLRYGVVTSELIRQRKILEAYIRQHPAFETAMEPVDLLPEAPESAVRMARAARSAGVGPMAAVAGALAQLAAEAALAAGAGEVIIDNGGDLYLAGVDAVTLALETGTAGLALALEVTRERMPVAVCSSSGTMGHSLSLGTCDLATVVARDAALADAAATCAANRVRQVDDIDDALNSTLAIEGVQGVLIVKDDHIGLAGDLPPLVKGKK